MDGLMLDTERLSLQAWKLATEELGVEMTEDIYHQIIGRNSQDTKSILKSLLNEECSVEEIYTSTWDHYHKIISENPIPIKPGLIQLLDFLEEEEISKAVATSTKGELAERNLRSLDLYERFSVVIGGDQVKRGKPSPEIFLQAAANLGVSPAECVVLEDSENGIRAAHAAGSFAIMIPDLIPPSDEIRKLAYRVFNSINEFLVFFKDGRGIG